MAPEVPGQLRAECLPLYREAKRRGNERLSFKSDYLETTVTTVTPNECGQERVSVADWLTLDHVAGHRPLFKASRDTLRRWAEEQGLNDPWILDDALEGLHGQEVVIVGDRLTGHDPVVRDLRDRVLCWARRHGLTDQWFLDAVLDNLCAWSTFEEERRALRWFFPHSLTRTARGVAIYGPGLERFSYRLEADPPPVYNPGAETRAEYLARIELYADEREAALAQAGFRPTTVKRRRGGEPSSRHFEWLVRSQVQAWRPSRIADEYLGEPSLVNTVRDAVKRMVALVGVSRRRHPPGRPPTRA